MSLYKKKIGILQLKINIPNKEGRNFMVSDQLTSIKVPFDYINK